MKLPKDDTHFIGCAKTGKYQYNTLEIALSFVDKKRTAIDVGAHVGFWSTQLAKHFERVYAFEPQPENYRCLVDNTRNLEVIAFNVACGETQRNIGLHNPAPDNSGAWETVEDGEIEMIPLDMLEIQDVDLVKIDVQGYEKQVLEGALETLNTFEPIVIVEIVHNGKTDMDTVDFLRGRFSILKQVNKDLIGRWISSAKNI